MQLLRNFKKHWDRFGKKKKDPQREQTRNQQIEKKPMPEKQKLNEQKNREAIDVAKNMTGKGYGKMKDVNETPKQPTPQVKAQSTSEQAHRSVVQDKPAYNPNVKKEVEKAKQRDKGKNKDKGKGI